MMALLFLILTIALLFARKGNYTIAIACFVLLLLLSVGWFVFHITEPVNIHL